MDGYGRKRLSVRHKKVGLDLGRPRKHFNECRSETPSIRTPVFDHVRGGRYKEGAAIVRFGDLACSSGLDYSPKEAELQVHGFNDPRK